MPRPSEGAMGVRTPSCCPHGAGAGRGAHPLQAGQLPQPGGVPCPQEVRPSPLFLLACQRGPGSVPPWLMVTRRPSASSCACRTRNAPPARSAACGTAAGRASPLCGVRSSPQPATSWVPAARGHRAGLAAAAGLAWRGPRGAQGGGMPGAPIPQGGSTHPALTASSASSRHSLALAGKGCTRSCCFGAAPHPAAIAPLWVSKEVLLPAVPATPCPSLRRTLHTAGKMAPALL